MKRKYVFFVLLMLGTAVLILYSGFTLPTEVALLVLVSAVASDFLTTWRCMRVRGREGNPAAAFLFRKIGLLKSYILLAGIWVCFIVFRYMGSSEAIQTAVALSYWLVPVNNLIVLIRLTKKNSAQGSISA